MTCQSLSLQDFRFSRQCAGLVRIAIIALLGVSFVANQSSAQLTTQMLIGDAVSEEVGNKYPDIDEAVKRFGNRD